MFGGTMIMGRMSPALGLLLGLVILALVFSAFIWIFKIDLGPRAALAAGGILLVIALFILIRKEAPHPGTPPPQEQSP